MKQVLSGFTSYVLYYGALHHFDAEFEDDNELILQLAQTFIRLLTSII